MSFFYSFPAYLTPYLQPLYSLYAQPDLQTPSPPLLFTNSPNPAPASPDAFKPFLLASAPTCESIEAAEKRGAERGSRSARREISKGRDENFGWRNQNKDRNVISSILKGFVHYVMQGRGMVKAIEQIAKKLGVESGVSRFYEFMGEGFRSRKSYVGLRFMQDKLAAAEGDRQMTAILAITLRVYLKSVYPLTVVQGQKLKKKARMALLKKARTLLQELFAQ